MTKEFKPLLAVAMKKPKYPYLASPKLDGIRCIIIDGVACGRSLKPLPNKHLQKVLGNHQLNGLDGEIIVGSPTHKQAFGNTTSVVMSHNKVEDFTFHVFDSVVEPKAPFLSRLDSCKRRHSLLCDDLKALVSIVPHTTVQDQKDLDSFEDQVVGLGYEGVMLRDPVGIYKYGRSTVNQNILLKVKRFVDAEAEVVSVEEMMHNDNPKEISELGNTKRATKKEGLTPSGMLGALVVKDTKTGVQFNIGTGFTKEQRVAWWEIRDKLIGRQAKYKHFPVGAVDKPRLPVFLGWRAKIDL